MIVAVADDTTVVGSVDDSTIDANTTPRVNTHICELHPLLSLESIPGSGMGYRVAAVSTSKTTTTDGCDLSIIKKGEVLLTESSICSGPLTANNADSSMVSQFIAQVQNKTDSDGCGHYYKGPLRMASLTVSKCCDDDDESDSGDNEPTTPPKSSYPDAPWVQRVLDNNVYQCRREPQSSALFVALARFNHSCLPNAINDACGKLARVRAVRDIAGGEEVTISYVPLGNDLQRRTEALSSFGIICECDRCVCEREFDPSMECGGEGGGGCDDVFVGERHDAVVAANAALDDAAVTDDDGIGTKRLDSLRETVETALLLAPFATHPETTRLHRGLIQLLQKMEHNGDIVVIMEQLREIKRLDLAHGGAKHRSLCYLRTFARLLLRCRKSCAQKKEYVEARWVDLCLLHFGEQTAPDAFMATVPLPEDVVQYIPIGCEGERLALFDGDDEIDLSGHDIGDTGCRILCTAISQVSPLVLLDLDSNGLSSVGGMVLADALAAGHAPLLQHLDLMCNNIGSSGACALAAALDSCPLLTYIDLHGNDIRDEGCSALGAALSGGACAMLVHLNLSRNGIEVGCAALSSLFCGSYDGNNGSGRVLAHLDLSENAIECCSSLFCSNDEASRPAVSSLTHLDLSWNCINDFEPFCACITQTCCCNAIVVLRIEGNALSDRECNLIYVRLKDTGITPMLDYEENNDTVPSLVCEEDGNNELRLRRCLSSLADGETINLQVCAEDIWEINDGATTTMCTPAQDPDKSQLQNLLERDGFFVVPQLFLRWGGNAGNDYTMNALASTMDRLDRAGYPPLFCFMSNSVWDLVSNRLWDEMRKLLGDDCVLEPSVFAWYLKSTKGGDGAPSSSSSSKIGQSFGLPHRDYSASESMFDDKKTPKLLNVWIPVNDTTLENGCMNILPREFDDNFCRSEDYAHMRSATPVRENTCKLRFALNGARAVPAKAGSLLAWCGNTIHWGNRCSQFSGNPPRKSIAMTFRRRDVAQLEGAGVPITQECARNMSMNMRLALISRSLLLYNQWHTLNCTAVPQVMYNVTSV